jgi:GWxTD domain-containing protein
MKLPGFAALALLLLPAAAAGSDRLAAARDALANADTSRAIKLLNGECARARDPAPCLLLGTLYRTRGTIEGRLHSQSVLETARARFPDDLDVRTELGRTYYAQRFYPDAVKCFEWVLARDPSRCDARTLLARYHYQNWKRMNEYRDNLATARRELRAVVRCDTSNAEAAFMFLVANYSLDDPPLDEADRMIRRFPDRPEFRMFRGALAWEDTRFDDCRRDFADGLARMDPEMRETYGYIGQVLPVNDRIRFDDYQIDDQATFQRAYWIRSDPDPTSALNERELEHIYRMFMADARFSNAPTGKHGWETDRGEAFLKFGEPMSINYTLGDSALSGKIEIWSYAIGGVFHQFLFVDEFLNGNPRIPYSADIHLHFMRHAPRQSSVRPTVLPVPGLLDVAVFRDDNLSGSVYFAMRIDADSMRAAVDLPNRYVVRGATFDPEWRRGAFFADTLLITDVFERQLGDRAGFDIVRRINAPFDRMHVACAFEDDRVQARAIMLGDADAARFVDDRLILSDVLLVMDSGPPGARIERRGEELWPRIDHTYHTGEMLRAYVEIYNLSRVARRSDYDVRFAIYPARDESQSVWGDITGRLSDWLGFEDDSAVISQTFRRAGASHDDHESIGINIGSLPTGRYQLVVEVTDRPSGRTAAAHVPFERIADRIADR